VQSVIKDQGPYFDGFPTRNDVEPEDQCNRVGFR